MLLWALIKFFPASSDKICLVKGNTGDGKNRGSCEEGLICFSDGSCKDTGK